MCLRLMDPQFNNFNVVFWHRRNSCNLSQIWNVIHSSEPRYLETIADWNSDGSVTQDETDDKNFFCVSECYLGGVIIAHSSNLLLKRQLIRSVKFRSYNRVLINGVTLIRMKMCEWVGACEWGGACVLVCKCVCVYVYVCMLACQCVCVWVRTWERKR